MEIKSSRKIRKKKRQENKIIEEALKDDAKPIRKLTKRQQAIQDKKNKAWRPKSPASP